MISFLIAFWWDFETLFDHFLAHFWPAPGQLLASFWPAPGQLLASFWPAFGQLLASFWPVSGQILDQIWIHFGERQKKSDFKGGGTWDSQNHVQRSENAYGNDVSGNLVFAGIPF